MQGSEACAHRSRGGEGNRPQEPSSSASTVEYGTHSLQRTEAPVVARRQPGGDQPVGSPAQLALFVKSLRQRDVQPRHYKVDLGRADLALNYQSPGWKFPQEGSAHPECEPELAFDEALGRRLQQPDGVDFIRIQLAERRRAIEEGKAGSFTFAPLLTTLGNIKKFVGHIGSGRHFGADHPLSDKDREALQWLERRAEALLQEKAPYELTVHLAFAFLAVYEVMLGQRVTAPRQPDGEARRYYELADMEPHEITAYRWGGNNTAGPQSAKECYGRESLALVRTALDCLLHEPHMLLYPSFQPLRPADFCRLGHLPVHPIGMITNYACNADGSMYGPLGFAMHDIGHVHDLSQVEVSDIRPVRAADAMRSSAHRLILRQMLLDASSPTDLRPGLCILQFHILHEQDPDEAARLLENADFAFPRCLEILLDTLRGGRAGYLPDDINITDSQACMAALWGARLLCRWRAAGFEPLSQQQRDLCARTFETQEGPRLQQHLGFIARHRGRLRQMFIGGYSKWIEDTPGRYRSETGFGHDIGVLSGLRMTLFDSIDSYAGLCHLDNIDLAYFAALTSSTLRYEMEQCTRARLPTGILYVSQP